TTSGPQAYRLGIADALFEPADFLEQSIAWAAKVISGEITVQRPNAVSDPLTEAQSAAWDAAVAKAKAIVKAKTSNAAPAPLRLIELFEKGKTWSKEESFA
ncbi:hypothetical protein LJD41_26210, partial [Escherichia coli]|nr:hypothetical protein [Escherichia coli]